MKQLGSPVFGTPTPQLGQRNRQEIPRPRHFSVREDGRSLRISFLWVWRRFTGAAQMCLLWNCFIVGWYWSALRTPEKRMMWFALVWCLPHAAVGLLLIYATLAGLLNRTVIKVTSEFLTVRHGPVPWFGNRRMRLDELEWLSCEKETDPEKKGRSYVYGVKALTKGASKVDLITDLEKAQARFIKQELERWLHLDDQGVEREGHS
jgi:hypothetical protein